jgi:hypothetical protein
MCLIPTGQVVATPAALEFCEQHNINPLTLVQRHSGGDWGDLDADDVAANVTAIQHDLRVFSSYKVGEDKVWVITEADRRSTCVLLPSCY